MYNEIYELPIGTLPVHVSSPGSIAGTATREEILAILNDHIHQPALAESLIFDAKARHSATENPSVVMAPGGGGGGGYYDDWNPYYGWYDSAGGIDFAGSCVFRRS